MLKDIRKERGLTQEELSKGTGLTLRTIARIEKTNKCDLDSARKISLYLGVSIEEIFFK